MKRILGLLSLSLVLVLSGCLVDSIEDMEGVIFSCVRDSELGSCESWALDGLQDLEMRDWAGNRLYSFVTSEMNFNVNITHTNDMVFLVVYVTGDEIEMNAENYENFMGFSDDLVKELYDLELEKDFRVTVRYTFDTGEGLNQINIVKENTESTPEISVSFRVDDFTLNTIEDNKDLISSVLNDSYAYSVGISMHMTDTTIDNVLNFLQFDMSILQAESIVYYLFQPDNTLVELDITYEEFYNSLFAEFDNYTFQLSY